MKIAGIMALMKLLIRLTTMFIDHPAAFHWLAGVDFLRPAKGFLIAFGINKLGGIILSI